MTTIYRSDFETFGFRRSEIIAFLKEHGIDITLALETIRSSDINGMQQSEPPGPAPLDWRELVAHWPTLSTTECADVMLDLNPAAERGYGFYDNNEEFSTWRRTIENACGSRALDAKGKEGDWRVTPAALIKWCDQYGYKCPLRIPHHVKPAAKAEAERDRLQKEVERLRDELRDVGHRFIEHGLKADQLQKRVIELEAKAPQYLDPAHDRYSPRLAAAVRAWEAVSGEEVNGSAKQVLSDWLKRHANEFRNLSSEAISQCAYVANWKTTGGRAKGTVDDSD